MFPGNVILLTFLLISFLFTVAAVWNLSITIRNRSNELTSVYSGFAVFFSFTGIMTWFIFALIAVQFVNTMTFGVWFLLVTAMIQFVCYVHNRYYVGVFNKSTFYRQMLDTDELKKGPLSYRSQELLGSESSEL